MHPTRPQVLARGGVIDCPASSSKTIQPLHAAAVLLPAARPPDLTGDEGFDLDHWVTRVSNRPQEVPA